MALTLGDALSAVATEGGFDSASSATSDSVMRGWINESIQLALAESKYRKAAKEFGPTVAGQAQYAIPEDVVDVRTIRVDGSRPWLKLPSIEDLWNLQAASGRLSAVGAFIENHEADGDPVIELWPAPSTAGLSIEGACAVLPDQITAATSTALVLPLPRDVERQIAVDGAIMLGKLRIDEREDLAAPFAARFQGAVDRLTKRAKTRVGSGPAWARIVRPGIR